VGFVLEKEILEKSRDENVVLLHPDTQSFVRNEVTIQSLIGDDSKKRVELLVCGLHRCWVVVKTLIPADQKDALDFRFFENATVGHLYGKLQLATGTKDWMIVNQNFKVLIRNETEKRDMVLANLDERRNAQNELTLFIVRNSLKTLNICIKPTIQAEEDGGTGTSATYDGQFLEIANGRNVLDDFLSHAQATPKEDDSSGLALVCNGFVINEWLLSRHFLQAMIGTEQPDGDGEGTGVLHLQALSRNTHQQLLIQWHKRQVRYLVYSPGVNMYDVLGYALVAMSCEPVPEKIELPLRMIRAGQDRKRIFLSAEDDLDILQAVPYGIIFLGDNAEE
jgi:hypothetical protein